MSRPATNKRERLVTSATELFHAQGFQSTSLADVAKAAGVAPGNVFYYFRTKDQLALAVLDSWVERLAGYMASFETDADRWARLERFVEQPVAISEMYVTLGCPLAGLTRDLRRANQSIHAAVPRVYAVQYEWLAVQFQDLSFAPDEADVHVRFLMTSIHGAILLAYSQGDTTLIAGTVKDLKDWLRRLRDVSGNRAAPADRHLEKSATRQQRDVG